MTQVTNYSITILRYITINANYQFPSTHHVPLYDVAADTGHIDLGEALRLFQAYQIDSINFQDSPPRREALKFGPKSNDKVLSLQRFMNENVLHVIAGMC